MVTQPRIVLDQEVAAGRVFKLSSDPSSINMTAGVTVTDSQGSVTFPQGACFDSRTDAASYMIFNVSTSLAGNARSRINMTVTPVSGVHMQISFVDNSEEVAVQAGPVTSARWLSANTTLVIYTLSTSGSILMGTVGITWTTSRGSVSVNPGPSYMLTVPALLFVAIIVTYVVRARRKPPEEGPLHG